MPVKPAGGGSSAIRSRSESRSIRSLSHPSTATGPALNRSPSGPPSAIARASRAVSLPPPRLSLEIASLISSALSSTYWPRILTSGVFSRASARSSSGEIDLSPITASQSTSTKARLLEHTRLFGQEPRSRCRVELVSVGNAAAQAVFDWRAYAGSLPQRLQDELPYVESVARKRLRFAAASRPGFGRCHQEALIMMGLKQVAQIPRTVGCNRALIRYVVRCGVDDDLRFLQAEAQPERAGRANRDRPPPRLDPLLERKQRRAITLEAWIGPLQCIKPLRVEAIELRVRSERRARSICTRQVIHHPLDETGQDRRPMRSW